MAILIPSLSDSSLISEIPSIFLSLTSSAIFSINFALLTWKGSSVTIIDSLSVLLIFSIDVLALRMTLPFPVSYALLMPSIP